MKEKCEIGEEEATTPHQHRTRYRYQALHLQISFESFQESFEEAKQKQTPQKIKKQQNFTQKEERTNP